MQRTKHQRKFTLAVAAVTVLITGGALTLSARQGSAPAPSIPSVTHLPTSTRTASATPLPTMTPSASATPTATWTATQPPTPTSTEVPSITPTPTATRTATPAAMGRPPRWGRVNLGPYLQSPTSRSMTIVWQTSRRARGGIEFGREGEDQNSLEALAPSYNHEFNLKDLDPGTTYTYRLLREGAIYSRRYTFTTAPEETETSLRFVVYGDTQHDMDVHREIIARARALDPDFVLHVGDLVNVGTSLEKWTEFFDIEGPLMRETALFPTMGNHELNHAFYLNLFSLPGNERWYTFTYGPARFVCLQVDGYADFSPGSPQQRWLERTLAKNESDWLFVFFHKPPFSAEYEGAQESDMRVALTPLFERYGVDVVFNGHNHNYQRSFVNGVFYVVTGGGGGWLSYDIDRAPPLLEYRVDYHLMLVEIDGNSLEARALKPDGVTLDSFKIVLQ